MNNVTCYIVIDLARVLTIKTAANLRLTLVTSSSRTRGSSRRNPPSTVFPPFEIIGSSLRRWPPLETAATDKELP